MYNALSDYPYHRVWVLDRCRDMSENILRVLGEDYVRHESDDMESRFTSTCRNIGYARATEDGPDDVLFLDGDRYPVLGRLDTLEKAETDVTLLMLQRDMRDEIADYSDRYGRVFNFFFSCGIMIKADACRKLEEFYAARRGDYGQSTIFPVTVERRWGIEDTHLGDICYHLGLTCGLDRTIRLNGGFSNSSVVDMDVVEERFRLRNKLDVIWDGEDRPGE